MAEKASAEPHQTLYIPTHQPPHPHACIPLLSHQLPCFTHGTNFGRAFKEQTNLIAFVTSYLRTQLLSDSRLSHVWKTITFQTPRITRYYQRFTTGSVEVSNSEWCRYILFATRGAGIRYLKLLQRSHATPRQATSGEISTLDPSRLASFS